MAKRRENPTIKKRGSRTSSTQAASLTDTPRWQAAADAVKKDFTPLTDLRASADYRGRVAGNLVIKALAEIAGVASDVTRISDRRMPAHAAE